MRNFQTSNISKWAWQNAFLMYKTDLTTNKMYTIYVYKGTLTANKVPNVWKFSGQWYPCIYQKVP